MPKNITDQDEKEQAKTVAKELGGVTEQQLENLVENMINKQMEDDN
jgi:hypothetical protein